MKSLTWRNVHFCLSLIVVAQVTLWVLTGVGFALLPADELRGQRESRNAASAPVSLEDARAPIADIVQHIEASRGRRPEVRKVSLIARPDGRLVYHVSIAGESAPLLYDAGTGDPAPFLSEADAVRIAHGDFIGDGDVTAVRRLETAEDVDYEGPFPVYRVDFSNTKHTRLYISPYSGQILRRHNIYQTARSVFWTLHVFGYLDRDVAGNVPLLVSSAISLAGIMSGTMLLVPYFRRRVAAMAPPPRQSAPSLALQPERD